MKLDNYCEKNQERDEKVLNLFEEGKKCSEIVKELGISKVTVKKVLLNFGIDYSEKIKEDKEWKINQIPIFYSQGKSQSDLEKELKLTRKTIRQVLKVSGIDYRDQSDTISLANGHYINHDAFDDLTDPNTLYFIGFIYTDGHVTIDNRRNENSIQIKIHKQDRDVLEKFQKFLKCNYQIIEKDNVVQIRVYSKKLCKVLENLGFTSRKTYDSVPHDLLKDSRDFWRGCVDGDGCLHFSNSINSKQKYWIINLVGTIDTCLGLRDFIKDSGIENKRSVLKANGMNLYSICYASNIAKQVSSLLYQDASIYMNRKYEKYLEIQAFHK